MIEVMRRIYVGSDRDYDFIPNRATWAILHCCKHPFHCAFVGYRGSLSSNHPNYAFCRKNNEMALNLVDMDVFSPDYLEFNAKMFESAFAFLDDYRKLEYNLLIHCNKGESRGPTMGLMYISRLGRFDFKDFDLSVGEFRKLYPSYNPKTNIYLTTRHLWTRFVKSE